MTTAVDDGWKSPDSILFLFFMKLLNAITCIKPPDITRMIPIDAENGAETLEEFGTSSLIIIPNLATTKPSAITAIPVLTQAKYVLSLAM